MLPSDSLMTNYQVVLGSLLLVACSSSSFRATNAPNASGSRGTATGGVLGTGGAATGGVLGTGGSGTGGVLGTGGGGTGGVLGTAGAGSGGCDMAYCRNGKMDMVTCGSGYTGYVQCDKAKSGVECVTTGACPVLDLDAGVTDTRDGGTNDCGNRCAIDEICVAYFDGNCNSAGIACRKVSSSCKVGVQGATCFKEACGDDFCGFKDGQGFWGCNYPYCDGDTSRADAKCYGVGDPGP